MKLCAYFHLHRSDSRPDGFKLMFYSGTFTVLMTEYQFAGLFGRDPPHLLSYILLDKLSHRDVQYKGVWFSWRDAAQCCFAVICCLRHQRESPSGAPAVWCQNKRPAAGYQNVAGQNWQLMCVRVRTARSAQRCAVGNVACHWGNDMDLKA